MEASANEWVEIRVCFSCIEDRWSHTFLVPFGCSVLDLKRIMVQPGGNVEEDAVSFDLHRRGIRLPNLEVLHSDGDLDFQFVGAADGKRRLERDLAARRRQDEALALASQRELQKTGTDMQNKTKQEADEAVPLVQHRRGSEALRLASEREAGEFLQQSSPTKSPPSQEHSRGIDQCELSVLGLPADITVRELYALFSAYGEVTEVSLDGNSRAYVSLPRGAAEDAVAALHGRIRLRENALPLSVCWPADAGLGPQVLFPPRGRWARTKSSVSCVLAAGEPLDEIRP